MDGAQDRGQSRQAHETRQGTQQRRQDCAPRSIKHTVWIAFSLWTGFTFVAYFTPIDELAGELLSLNLGPWETFWILFYSFATYGNAGFMREQVCKYMCPYARFQSAMFDSDTLIVAYHPERGEPRGSRRRSVEPASVGLGDCIDCNVCVQVCPTGIDIRDGLQYECIACSAVHRRLQRDHGQDVLPARPDSLHHGKLGARQSGSTSCARASWCTPVSCCCYAACWSDISASA